MEENKKSVILNEKDIQFLKYFLEMPQRDDYHYNSIVVFLYLERIFKEQRVI